MAVLVRAGFSFAKNAIFSTSVRTISITKQMNIKEIKERKEGSTLIIEGVSKPSPRTDLLVRSENINTLVAANKELISTYQTENPELAEKPPCYMCALGLDVKHTDVLILSQFVRSDGCMLPRRITGLCRRQQKKIGKMVSMAQKAGLMSNLTPPNSKKDPKKRKQYKQFNTYFDEKTIFMRHIPKPVDRFKR